MGAAARMTVLAWLGAWLMAESAHGQIVFRNVDPRRMQMVPLPKEVYPPMPYLPKPRLHTENILPQHMTFDMIPKENLVEPNIRPNRIEVPPLVTDAIVQQPIAPRWLERGIQGPERLMPEPAIPRNRTRQDYEYQRPQFDPRTVPRPGYEGSMFLTPNFFTTRPIDPDLARSANTPAPAPFVPQTAPPSGRRPLGW